MRGSLIAAVRLGSAFDYDKDTGSVLVIAAIPNIALISLIIGNSDGPAKLVAFRIRPCIFKACDHHAINIQVVLIGSFQPMRFSGIILHNAQSNNIFSGRKPQLIAI